MLGPAGAPRRSRPAQDAASIASPTALSTASACRRRTRAGPRRGPPTGQDQAVLDDALAARPGARGRDPRRRRPRISQPDVTWPRRQAIRPVGRVTRRPSPRLGPDAGARRRRRRASAAIPVVAGPLLDLAPRRRSAADDRGLARGQRTSSRPAPARVGHHRFEGGRQVLVRAVDGRAAASDLLVRVGHLLGRVALGADPRLDRVLAQSRRIAIRSGRRRGSRVSASSMIRKRLLSRSTSIRRSWPTDSNSTGIPARRPRSRAARRSVGTRPRSSRTIGRTSKMNVFVASRVRWTIDDELARPRRRPRPDRVEQAFHDLGLEHDVRQALRRPVVHLPRDLAAQVLLGGEDHPRHRRRHRAAARRRARSRPRQPGARRFERLLPRSGPPSGCPARPADSRRGPIASRNRASACACPRARPPGPP